MKVKLRLKKKPVIIIPETKAETFWLGIDNGVSGTIGIIGNGFAEVHPMPIFKDLNYTKKKAWLNRINVPELRKILWPYRVSGKVYIERPLLNPMMFRASVSAIRALEATLIALQDLSMSFQYVDSKEWQKVMLPSGLKKGETKRASLAIGKRLFPHLILKSDADGILMAQWASQTYR